ncbi:MAG: tryptophan--tRNA ligase [Candidatus Peribacteraceae bacterium]|nr:tryptophan--tRNA ligase [Candidatus Peribacteraceae bacterium]
MRILTGLQPSGQLHIGNYFGSLKPNLELVSKAKESFLMAVDLHALTTVQDPALLRQYRHDIILDYLACGFDPDKSTIFFQSDVPAHTELMWILMTVTPMGLLERAVSYKDKVAKGIAASAGLFTYPVLMAADILLYDINIVPVGKDQKQHVEMARDIAMKFNNIFGDTLVVPEPQIREDVAVVPGTDGQKMSKSYSNTIPLFGDEKMIKKAIMGIVTDSKGVEEPKDPDTCTVFQIHKLFLSDHEKKELREKYLAGGMGYGDAKKMLFETYMDFMKPARERRAQLVADPATVEAIILSGGKKASVIAEATLMRAKKAVGLL